MKVQIPLGEPGEREIELPHGGGPLRSADLGVLLAVSLGGVMVSSENAVERARNPDEGVIVILGEPPEQEAFWADEGELDTLVTLQQTKRFIVLSREVAKSLVG